MLFDYLKETGSGTGYKLASCNPAAFANLLCGICNDYTATLSQPYHTIASNIARDGTDVDVYHLSNITTAEVGGATLKNIAGYRNLDFADRLQSRWIVGGRALRDRSHKGAPDFR